MFSQHVLLRTGYRNLLLNIQISNWSICFGTTTSRFPQMHGWLNCCTIPANVAKTRLTVVGTSGSCLAQDLTITCQSNKQPHSICAQFQGWTYNTKMTYLPTIDLSCCGETCLNLNKGLRYSGKKCWRRDKRKQGKND